jgi:hypothetical protein
VALTSPAGVAFDLFVPPLNDGERHIAEWLQSELSDDWTIYVQPRLHMAQPDFVCVHAELGVVVIEVKDWAPHTYKREGGKLCVLSHGSWQETELDPIKQAKDYHYLIWNEFVRTTQGLDYRYRSDLVRWVVVFLRMSQGEAWRLTSQEHIDESSSTGAKMTSNSATAKNVIGENFHTSLRGVLHRKPKKLPQDWDLSLRKLHFHLGDADDVRERRGPLRLSQGARNIAQNPNQARVRRVRGAPGSGKSLGLASRAAALALQGKSVLLLAFNITMSNYLTDLTKWALRDQTQRLGAESAAAERAAALRRIAFTYFFDVVRTICEPPERDEGESFFDSWVEAAMSCYKSGQTSRCGNALPRFDSILVDEGQDFKESYWSLLYDHVLKEGGEAVIVCDRAQKLYETQSWIDGRTEFRGWTELRESFRLPRDVLRPVSQILQVIQAEDATHQAYYIPPELPAERQGSLFPASNIEWVNVEGDDPTKDLSAWIEHIVDGLSSGSQPNGRLAAPDVVFMTDSHKVGVSLVNSAMAKVGAQFQSVFDTDPNRQQERKKSFWPGAGGCRFCTVHSFKGWESRAVAYLATSASTTAQLYVALTRLRSEPSGTAAQLYVRNFNRDFDRFKAMITDTT